MHTPHDAAECDASDFSTARLAQLVHQKHTLILELHKLVIKQRQLIQAGELDLLALLAVKQKVITALTQVDRRIDPFRQQDPEQRQWNSVADRQACRHSADQAEQLLREVMDIEQFCSQAVEKQQAETQEKLQGAVSARTVTQAYRQEYHSPSIHRQLDLTSEG